VTIHSLLAHRAVKPPTSSSLADEKRVGSLLLSTAARDPRFDCSLPLAAMLAGLPLSSSLAEDLAGIARHLSTNTRIFRPATQIRFAPPDDWC
jgi:hypothetical protein